MTSPLLFSLLTAMVLVVQLSTSLYVPSLPSIGVSLGADAGLVKLTMTVYLAAFGVAQLILGPLSDRFGRRPVLLWGLVLYIIASAACAVAPSIDLLILGRIVQAVGGCACMAISRAVVRDKFDRAGAVRVMATMGMVMAVSPAIGPVLGGQLQLYFGWRSTFVVLALFGMTILAWVYSALAESNQNPDPNATDPRHLMRNTRLLLSHREFVGHMLVMGCCFAGLFGFVTSLPFVMVDVFAIPPHLFSLLFIFTVAGFFVGSALTRALTQRGVGPDRLIAAGAVLGLVGAALVFGLDVAGVRSVAAIIAPLMLYMASFGLIVPSAMAAGMQPFPAIAGTASALLGFIQMGMAALGSLVVAAFYDGTARALVWTVLVSAIVALLAERLLLRKRA